MKISYHNWPALQAVDVTRCMGFMQSDHDLIFCTLETNKDLSPNDIEKIKQSVTMEIGFGFYTVGMKVYYISSAFREALNRSCLALYKMLGSKEMCEKAHEDCAFIDGDMLWVVKTDPRGWIRMIRLHKTGALFTSFAYRFVGDDSFETMLSSTTQAVERSCVAYYYLLMMLKKYGQVDIETVTRNGKIRSSVLNDKAINETGIDVKVLDSRWFTTICRDEGFLVSGHFRLQPCKDEQGEWTRKLIYINPYAKHGYHRLAPIVNIDNENKTDYGKE